MTDPENVEKDNSPVSKIQRIQEQDKPREDKIEEVHQAVQELNKSINNLEEENKALDYEIEGDYVALVGISDLHYGNKNVEMDYVEKIINFVSEHERAYAFLNGDIIANWVEIAPKGGIYEQTIKPEFQLEIMEKKLEPIKDSIIAVIYGNHEGRSQKAGEENPMGRMSKELDIPYLGPGGRINLNFNGIEYKVHARHRYRYESSINPTHACKRLVENLDMEADIVAIGHNHDPAISQIHKGGKLRTLIRFGCAMPSTRYSSYRGYKETPPLAPSVLLGADRKIHEPFMELSVIEKFIKNLEKSKGSFFSDIFSE